MTIRSHYKVALALIALTLGAMSLGCASRGGQKLLTGSGVGTLLSVEIDPQPDSAMELVTVRSDRDIEYIIYKLTNPDRVALELKDLLRGESPSFIDTPESAMVEKIGVVSFEEQALATRLELYMKGAYLYEADSEGAELKVRLTPTLIDRASHNGANRELDNRVALFLSDWVNRWSARDIDAYQALYHPDFKEADGSDRAAWIARKNTLFAEQNNIQIEIGDLNVARYDGLIYATFYQRYRSDKFNDHGVKSLTLKELDGVYKIIEERWRPIRTKAPRAI